MRDVPAGTAILTLGHPTAPGTPEAAGTGTS